MRITYPFFKLNVSQNRFSNVWWFIVVYAYVLPILHFQTHPFKWLFQNDCIENVTLSDGQCGDDKRVTIIFVLLDVVSIGNHTKWYQSIWVLQKLIHTKVKYTHLHDIRKHCRIYVIGLKKGYTFLTQRSFIFIWLKRYI